MKIGYARVSTSDQNLDLQIDSLKKHGCEKIYKEVVSGAKKNRPMLDDMLKNIREGDEIVIWKLDRLGRSLKHLVELTNNLSKRNIGLISISDPIDTTTSQGKLIFNIFASLAEFERDLISDRTRAGLESARSRGRFGGRPRGLSEKAETTACAAELLYKEGIFSVKEISDKLNISKKTLYNYLKHRKVKIGKEKKEKGNFENGNI